MNAERPRWIRRAATALLCIYALALIYGTHTPSPPKVVAPLETADKLLHFSAYLGLALLTAVNWRLRRPFGWRQAAIIVALCALFGALDEITQIPVGRDCEWLDWLADVSGSVAGVSLLAALVTWAFRPATALHEA